MRRRDERDAARRLARVLDGAETGDVELEAVARLLRDAAASARVEVSAAEIEEALGGARRHGPAPPSRRVGRRGVGFGLGAAVAVAAALLLLLPFASGPVTVDVQARALSALGGGGDVLRMVEIVRPGPSAAFPASVRTGWLDPSHDQQRWTQAVGGRIVAETLVDHERVTRYDPATGTATVAASCTALASGCAEATDPVAFYRRALAAAGNARAQEATVAGHRVYRFRLPVQRLPDAVRIAQVVSVDATTFRPVRIEWRERTRGGQERTAAVIEVNTIQVIPPEGAPPNALALLLPPGTHVTQLAAPATPVRLLGARRIGLAEAGGLRPAPLWLGRRYGGYRLGAITLLRYTGGTALRLRYGPFTVWNYGRVVPPPLIGAALPLKTALFGSGVARFYASRHGRLVGELDRPGGGTTAVVAPQRTKETIFAAVAELRPI